MTERTPAELDKWLNETEELFERGLTMGLCASSWASLVDKRIPELLRLVRELQAENRQLRADLQESQGYLRSEYL